MIDIEPAKVEELASRGLTMEQIALCLGCCVATLYNRAGSELEVLEAIKRGRASGVQEITNALFNNALEGNTTAQIFYLKNRAPNDWKDRKDTHFSGEIKHSGIEVDFEGKDSSELPAETTTYN